MINRARANPQGEASRYGIDLNEGLDAGTISTTPKPPLVMNPLLISSARGHSQWMLDNDVFLHTGAGGSDLRDRVETAGYSLGTSWQLAENLALQGTSGTVDQTAFVLLEHESLFVSPGHRENIMAPDLVELGIGALVGLYTQDGDEFNALMTTQNFARSSASPTVSPGSRFLLGIVYEDVDQDGFYTPGEGMAGVTVRPDSGDFYAVTSSSGGYALPLPAGLGSVNVTLSDGGWEGPAVFEVTTTGDNVQRDFVFDPDALPEPRSFVLDSPGLTVPEGQTAELSFHLSAPPDSELQAMVTTFFCRSNPNGPGTTHPAGDVLVDLDDMPFSIQAVPTDDADFLYWNADNATVTPFDSSVATVTTTTNASIVAFFLAFDSDEDGMGDAWEIEHFGDLSHTGLDDTDGDGISDLGEFLIQSNPHVQDIGITVLVLYPGWNAVSVPAEGGGQDVNDIFAAHVQGDVWQWRAQTQKYAIARGPAVETLSYWVYAPDYTAIVFD